MADTNINNERDGGGGGGSAVTVLVTIVIILIIALAFYFGFRGNLGNNDANGGVNVELNTPDVIPEGGGATQ